MQKLQAWLDMQGYIFWVIAGSVSLGLAALLDLLTGYRWALSLFYLLPIAWLTWRFSWTETLAVAAGSGLVAFLLDLLARPGSAPPAACVRDGLIRLGLFIAWAVLVMKWKLAHLRAETNNRFDAPTGLFNASYFTELVDMEVERNRRTPRPFSIVYMGLANFVGLTGSLSRGDDEEALRLITAQARGTLRKVDLLARIGGGKFAFLLPETNQRGAQVAMLRVQAALLDEIHKHNWSVVVSMGVVTCLKPAQSGLDLIQRASELMLQARKSGENMIQYSTDEDNPL
jgi:diguanylate cyclase (GGDEF)-like protein